MAKLTRYVLPLLLLLALPACDSTEDDPEPTLDGTWRGTTTLQGGTIEMRLELIENDRNVTGTGRLNIAGSNFNIGVRGVHNYPRFSLTIIDDAGPDLTFEGTLAGGDAIMNGTLSTPDSNIQIELDRLN